MSSERERIRAREREKLAKSGKGSLRPEAKAFMSRIVEGFNVSRWLGTEGAKTQLAMAGYRGQGAEVTFLFFRLIMPLVCGLLVTAYVFIIADLAWSTGIKIAICIAAFPDTLDLLLICVESGMSLEHAGRKVSQEIGIQAVAMAEELTLTMAEMSYLPDRRQAFENLAKRTGLELMKSLTTVLIQAERYGTPLGAALRVLSQEGRDHRMMEAEKKAASLPPKLTVPMILFFLPVLFIIIGTPAAIQMMAATK